MSDDVARALGAGGASPFMINGKEVTPKPLNLKQITELQRDCVSQYRLGYLQRIKDGLSFMELDDPRAYMNNLVETSARWDVDDLPSRSVFDTTTTPLTPELESWAKQNVPGYESKKNEVLKRRYIAFALDSELLTEEEYLKRANVPVVKINTGYVNWWVTGTPEGMLAMVWHTVKEDGISKEELGIALVDKQGVFTELSREIESISAPAVAGNGEDSTKAETTSPE
jgi:hypothetical protein